MENPGYEPFFRLFQLMNVNVFPLDVDIEGFDINKVRSINPNMVYISSSHMRRSQGIKLLNWAGEEENRFIVEDNYDSHFKHSLEFLPSLHSIDKDNRVIYISDFSRALLPSFLISYMILPPQLIQKYRQHYSDLIQGSDLLQLFALHYFIESGAYLKHVRRMKTYYNAVQKLLMIELRSKFGDKIRIISQSDTLQFLVEIETDKGYDEIEKNAMEVKLEINTIRQFILEEQLVNQQEIQLVIGFTSLKKEDIQVAVDRLYRAIC